MSSSAPLITPSIEHIPLHRRLELLEQRCAELWADEPRAHVDREAAFAQVSEIEHRVASLILTFLAEPDDPTLAAEAVRCERDVARVAVLWTTPRAA